MAPPFERSEYTARLRRTRAAMREAGLDVLLVFHQEHMFYLAGYDQIGYWVYQVLIVPAAEAPMTAIVRKVDELLVRDGGIVDDVRVWLDDATRDPAQQTADILTERGLLRGARIGIERKSHALLPYYYDLLRDALQGAELVDASDLVTELRLIKSPAEIACMRRAGEVMDAGVQAAWEALRPGARECDVHAAVVAAMYRAGGEHPSVAPPMGTGPRTLTQTHGAATTREVRAGDPFLLEVGGCYRRYHAVCMRTASVGAPGDRLRSMHDAIREATDAGLAAIKPGVRTAEVARLVHAQMAERGYSRRGQHVGYGIGLGYPPTWIDNLRIKETDTHVLQAGMSFLFHAGLLAPEGDLYVALGDPVLVTATGPERLTRLSRDLTLR
ncbi:MAG TPA: Xaa-Pro peptidase family protein [Methylomirabilota bacterium]|jgi:Xaa-Pro dipeptidase|nr:Xaa-Pro peptidase family protein [Methylomirabilota bacterium]